MEQKYTRRDFLRMSGLYSLAFYLTPFWKIKHKTLQTENEFEETNEPLGRVTANSIILYNKPSDSAGFIKTLSFNTVLPITKVVLGESTFSHNKVWYELDGQGFAHSGNIQPVQVKLNEPIKSLPQKGMLAEVTVPYTNSLLHPSWPDAVVYKLYYGSTFWINRISTDNLGKKWYRIEDEEGYIFYANSRHLHVLTEEELAPISPEVSPDHKRIEVHIKDQKVVALEKDKPVFMTRTATGAKFHTGDFSTPKGQFLTTRKRPSRHMKDPAGSSYDLPGVPWVCYITTNGVAFHGTYWHNDFGAPRSHGCINLSSESAKWLYQWTIPNVPLGTDYLEDDYGTQVDIW